MLTSYPQKFYIFEETFKLKIMKTYKLTEKEVDMILTALTMLEMTAHDNRMTYTANDIKAIERSLNKLRK